MVWMVRKDPQDPARRFLLPTKSNLAAEPTALAFRILDGQVAYDHDPVDWLPDQSASQSGQSTSALQEATTWLTDALTPGPVEMTQLQQMSEEDGIAFVTLKRAKKKLQIISSREKLNGQHKWYWKLPPNDHLRF